MKIKKLTEPTKPTKPKQPKFKDFEKKIIEKFDKSLTKSELIAVFRKYEHEDFTLEITKGKRGSRWSSSVKYSLAIVKMIPAELSDKQKNAENIKRAKYEKELKEYQAKLEKYRTDMIGWLDQEQAAP